MALQSEANGVLGFLYRVISLHRPDIVIHDYLLSIL